MYQIFPTVHREKLPTSNRTDIYLHENWSDIPSVTPIRSGDNQAFDFLAVRWKASVKSDYLEDLGITVLYQTLFLKQAITAMIRAIICGWIPLGTNDDLTPVQGCKARGIRVI